MMNNTYWIWDAVIPKELCEKFVDEYFTQDIAEDASYGEGNSMVVGEKRSTKVCWVSPETFLGAKLLSHALLANQKAGWGFIVDAIEPVQLGQYGVGGHYDWHADVEMLLRDGSNMQRKLSAVMFLSDPESYEGGDFFFYEAEHPIRRAQGTVVVFPSFLKHKVTPVTKGVRYSAVAWALGPTFR